MIEWGVIAILTVLLSAVLGREHVLCRQRAQLASVLLVVESRTAKALMVQSRDCDELADDLERELVVIHEVVADALRQQKIEVWRHAVGRATGADRR